MCYTARWKALEVFLKASLFGCRFQRPCWTQAGRGSERETKEKRGRCGYRERGKSLSKREWEIEVYWKQTSQSRKTNDRVQGKTAQALAIQIQTTRDRETYLCMLERKCEENRVWGIVWERARERAEKCLTKGYCCESGHFESSPLHCGPA